MSQNAMLSSTPRRDTVRKWVVLVCMVAAIVGSAIGSGAFGGTPIAEAAGGSLSADATRLAPAVPAFSIWSVIYFGLAAYTIWQLLPAHKRDPRQRRLGYPMAASLILNAAWILSVQAGWLAVSVIVIVLLVAVLAYAFRVSVVTRPLGMIEAVVVDGVIGLYLGWVCVATAANITSVLKFAGFTGWGIDPDVWAVVVVAVAGLVGVGLAVAGRGRLSPTASLCWGLAWVAVARFTGRPHSDATATAAIVAIVVVIIVTLAFRLRAPARVRA